MRQQVRLPSFSVLGIEASTGHDHSTPVMMLPEPWRKLCERRFVDEEPEAIYGLSFQPADPSEQSEVAVLVRGREEV